MNAPVKETSVMAIVSLVSGILGWTIAPFLGSIIAVITGHMARSDIRKNPATKDGDGLALAGLILGWVNILSWVLGIIFFGGMLLAFFGLLFAANGGH